MAKKLDLLVSEFAQGRVKLYENLYYHTGRQLDTQVEAFFIATNQKELIQVLDLCLELSVPFKVLGYDNIEPPKKTALIEGLLIKNSTRQIKISGIKGKFVIGSMGIDQVLLEVDSGVSLVDLRAYFVKDKLIPPIVSSDEKLTLGEVLSVEFGIQGLIENIKVWEKGVVDEISILEFNPKKQVVISAILKAKSANI